MKKSDTNERMLRLLEILYTKSDAHHLYTMPMLLDALEEYEIYADRRSVYAQIHTLQECGFPIVYTRKGQGYYYEHPFTQAEIFALYSAIDNLSALSVENSTRLKEKLHTQLPQFQPPTYTIANRQNKTENQHIFTYMDRIFYAIQHAYAVSFLYYDLEIDRKKHYRRNKERYHLVPYAIVAENQWFYCVCYEEKHQAFITFRIDKMEDVKVLEETMVLHPFQLEQFLQSSFNMYKGNPQTITIAFAKEMANYVFDQFGDAMIISKVTDASFVANIKTTITPTLLAWILQFQNQLTVLKPQELIDELLLVAEDIRKKYR